MSKKEFDVYFSLDEKKLNVAVFKKSDDSLAFFNEDNLRISSINKYANFEELEKQEEAGNPPDMATAFSSFMSGDNSQKLMNMVGKFGAKLQGEMNKGNINEADLKRQTDQMMGGQMGQMAHQMATSMATGNGVNINGQNISNKQMKEAVGRLSNDPKTQRRIQEANRANNTRDRLRAKLAAKQASQQSPQ